MSYVSPATRSAGYVVGATQWNEFVMNDRWMNESSTDGRPFCRAYRSTNQSVAHNVNTAISWNANQVDNAGCHSTVVNPSRFTAPVDGWYRLTAQLYWDVNASGIRVVQIIPNGIGGTDSGNTATAVGIFGFWQQCISVIRMTAGQYAEVIGYQSSGGALNMMGGQPAFACFEWIRTY